jgi:hypothetical protein
MSSSHSLVLVSILASILLSIFLSFYLFVFPKKKISFLTLTFLISCLPLVSLLRPGSYESGDLSLHIQEGMTFFDFLTKGDFFPVWGGNMNATYGYPAFQYTYPLPFYMMSFVHLFGFSFTNSAKIVLALVYILSGICMFVFLKKITGEKYAFVGTMVYQFAPYHLIDLHFRVTMGEIVAFIFLPLSLYAGLRFMETKNYMWFILLSFSIGLLILSHPAISMAGLPVIAVLLCTLLFVRKSKKSEKLNNFLFLTCSMLFGVLLAAFYWLPLIAEIRFTHTIKNTLQFINLADLLYSPWRYGLLFQGSHGELALIIGYAQLFVLFLACFYLFNKKIHLSDRIVLVVSLTIVGILSFMMLGISKPIWEAFTILQNFQFTYRLHGVVMFCIAIVAAIVAKYTTKKWLLYTICLVAIFTTILNWGNRKNLPDVQDKVLEQRIAMTAYHGGGINQAITVWSDNKYPYAPSIPAKHIEILKGEGTIKEINRTNTEHIYSIQANDSLFLRENTLYFPGWHVLVDKKNEPITILSQQIPKGIIAFSIPPGNHTVEVLFEDTPPRTEGKIISFASLLGLFVIMLSSKIGLRFPKDSRRVS